MRRFGSSTLFGLGVAVMLVFLAGCAAPANKPPTDRPDGKAPTEQTPEKPAAPSAEEQGKAVVQALKEKDMNKLARMVHPDKGIRFSPYGYVDADKDLTFKPAAIGKLFEDNNVYEWGTYDGSGEPIKLKFAEYYAKFIYDADFAKAPQTSVNKTIGKGNMANNMSEAYPAARYDFVEYHYSGFDKKFEGMDWKSLRLVFEKDGSRLLLVGIVHDQWTI
ncbi:hypothetical protein FE783_13355 [Paenibacillus mesophilus]|uniref:hypothetical protein n=1 Tax=Paenibacillus mesophilus TaxID=2582849 RepID=UPI00110F3CD9|nr:hypothetical protein [Paenibacillus mesophilus]TMV49489.1 hypothetical protein FE783_13355 [Paenibacillus mesophilus]